MNATSTAEIQQSLEQFRHLLFHLQMRCGSIHDIFRFFKEEKSLKHFEALKAIDPNLMPQLLAREYVLEAKQTEDCELAKKHLETALYLDPQCVEASLEMGNICESAESSMMWYQRCMDTTVCELGEERFERLIEDFKARPWQQVELHTYLKAKACLAEKLFRHGYFEVATLHFREFISWNPIDDLNLHHFLMVCLLCENKLKEAHELRRTFTNDFSANWYYCRVFLRYKMEGDTRRTRHLLQRAFRRNLWVPVYLLGLKEMPSTAHLDQPAPFLHDNTVNVAIKPEHPPVYKEGSRFEAVACVRCVAPAFLEDTQLVGWVWEALKEL